MDASVLIEKLALELGWDADRKAAVLALCIDQIIVEVGAETFRDLPAYLTQMMREAGEQLDQV
jgi:hypothetical protein